jgi:hypothetical protein
MTTVIALLQWIIANWQIIATAFSSLSSIALFFMHGNAKSEILLLKQFVDSLQVSQTAPVDTTSAQAVSRQLDPKK